MWCCIWIWLKPNWYVGPVYLQRFADILFKPISNSQNVNAKILMLDLKFTLNYTKVCLYSFMWIVLKTAEHVT